MVFRLRIPCEELQLACCGRPTAWPAMGRRRERHPCDGLRHTEAPRCATVQDESAECPSHRGTTAERSATLPLAGEEGPGGFLSECGLRDEVEQGDLGWRFHQVPSPCRWINFENSLRSPGPRVMGSLSPLPPTK